MNKLDFDIFVVANPHRKPLIESFVKPLGISIYKTPDYCVSKEWKSNPEWQYIYNAQGMKGANGHLRCNKGHQDCLKKMTKDKALMLEDDCIPNRKDWLDVVAKSLSLLDQYEIVSLHGRLLRKGEWSEFKHNGMIFLKPTVKQREVFACGSLAYLIRKDAAKKMINLPFVGMPQDMTICKKFSFCLLKQSPFNHDRRQGSLIE